MTMREMLLNRASIMTGDVGIATEFLKGIASGMSRLVREGVAAYTL